MITSTEILMGRDHEYPIGWELAHNLVHLVTALNEFRAVYGKPMRVSSGYRPGHYNTGYAATSAHLTCQACDFADPCHELAEFCLNHLNLLEDCGLYMESPSHTSAPNARSWVHLTTRAPASGNRVFIP